MAQTILTPPEKITQFLTPDLSSLRLTGEQFEQLCRDNPDLRLELTSTGGLIVMPPAGSKTGQRNFNLTGQLRVWVETDGTGIGFDSSTGFTLPDGAILSPDAAWVRKDKWEALSEEEQERFAPLCPDFVIELRSRWNTLKIQQDKIKEYLENGVLLAWLIDPQERRVYVYRPGEAVEILIDPTAISADPILPGFVLNVLELW